MKFCQMGFYVKREESELAAYIAQSVTGQSVALYDREDLKELNIEYLDESALSALPFPLKDGFNGAGCLIRCFCAPQDKEEVAAKLKEELSAVFLRDFDIVFEIIDEQSYINKWKEDFAPLKIKNLTVMPKGCKARALPSGKVIVIDTSMAFGTAGTKRLI